MEDLPILVISYNKPALLEKLLIFLQINTNSKIYIHLDGARGDSRSKELNLACERIVLSFAQKRENTLIKVSEVNLGGQKGVLNAIDWFFSHEVRGVILEEDIEISSASLIFARQYINHLEDPRFFSLCFFNPIQNLKSNFTLNHWVPWGWVTNRNKWTSFREHVLDNSFRLKPKPGFGPAKRLPVRRYLNSIIHKVETGRISTWDAQVHAWVLSESLISIFPAQTLAKHRGFIPEASHADLIDWWEHLRIASTTSSDLQIDGIEDRNRKFENLWRMTWRAMLSNFLHRYFNRL